MKKIIVIDLDGTALADGQTIAPETLTALKQAQKGGHEVVIATGRPLNAMAHFAQQIEPVAIITSNGAVVMQYHATQTAVIQKANLEGLLFEKLLATYQQEIATIWLEAHEQTYLNNLHPHLEVMFTSHRPLGFRYQIQPLTVTEYEQAQVCLLLLQSGCDGAELARKLTAQLPATYQCHHFEQNGVDYIEISFTELSKATGLAILNDTLQWTFSQMIAFGDQYNDVAMLQAVGHGVAMRNAPQEIKELADAVTTQTNQEGGVGSYLQTYLATLKQSEQ